MRKKLFLFLIFATAIIIGLFPIIYMIFKSIYSAGSFSFDSYRHLMSSYYHWKLMGHTILLSLSVSLLTFIFGVPLGILFEKTDLPFKKTFVALFSIPLLIPPYTLAFSWFNLFKKNGLIHSLSPKLALWGSNLLFSYVGNVFVLFSVFLPIVILLTIASLKSQDPSLEESALIVSSPKYVLKYITIPLILPYVFLAEILVFLFTSGELTVPSFLRYKVFPLESFTQFSAFYDFKTATAFALPLVFLTVFILLFEFFMFKNRNYKPLGFSVKQRILKFKLGKTKLVFSIFVTIFLFIIVILPLFSLPINLDLKTFINTFLSVKNSWIRSILYAGIGAVFFSIIGFFLAYTIKDKSISFSKSIIPIFLFLFTIPSSIIGIGLIIMWNNSFTNIIYATPFIILIGYLAKYLIISIKLQLSALQNIPESMENAAKMLGTSWFERIFYIILPMLEKTFTVTWLVGLVFFMRDTEITMIVHPAGSETLSVKIQTLMANGTSETIAAANLIMVLTIVVPSFILYKSLTSKV